MKDILIFTNIEISKLYPGVNRPQSWINKHPAFRKMQQHLIESIKKKGIKYPLCAVNEKDDGTYKITVGNQRLLALQTMEAELVPCLIYNKAGQKNIPSGKVIKGQKEILKLFGGKVKGIALHPTMFQVIAKDNPKWDPDRIFGGEN